MLTNKYIFQCLKHIKKFKGVYSADNAIKLTNKGDCIVINFDKSYQPGSHFIAVYLSNKNVCKYFDSLNLKEIPLEIAKYLSLYKKAIDCSKHLQSYLSTYCGFYSMLFLYSQSISSKYWLNNLKRLKLNSLKNDHLCINLLCKAINDYLNKK